MSIASDISSQNLSWIMPVIRQNSSRIRNQQFARFPQPVRLLSLLPMFHFFRFWLGSLSLCFHSRQSLLLENQQPDEDCQPSATTIVPQEKGRAPNSTDDFDVSLSSS